MYVYVYVHVHVHVSVYVYVYVHVYDICKHMIYVHTHTHTHTHTHKGFGRDTNNENTNFRLPETLSFQEIPVPWPLQEFGYYVPFPRDQAQALQQLLSLKSARKSNRCVIFKLLLFSVLSVLFCSCNISIILCMCIICCNTFMNCCVCH